MKVRKHLFNVSRSIALGAVAALMGFVITPVHAGVTTLSAANDTFITSGTSAGNNAGGQGWFDVGTDGIGLMRRGLLRFDLSSIPAGSTITSATLTASITRTPSLPSASTVDLLRLQAAWGEGTKSSAGSPQSGAAAGNGEATWIARLHNVTIWTDPGANGDAAGTASASAAAGTSGNVIWSGAGVVADVQAWFANPSQNFGWLLMSQNEDSGRSVRGFGSKEGAAPATLELRYATPNAPPTIAITNPTGGNISAPANILIEASAADDGSVAQVQFFDGAASLGTDLTSPFSVNASLSLGAHALTAVATDNLGASSTSAVVNVTVVTVPIANPIVPRIAKGDITVELRQIADGMVSPLGMAAPDDGSGRMFVYDQVGLVWVITSAGRLPTPLLDIRTRLVNISGGYDERGLLGVAVHPNFAQNPFIYTYSSEFSAGAADFPIPTAPTNNHQSVIAEWRLTPSTTNQVDPASRREVMRIDEPQSNHNGGTMRFGPDGFLYVSLGDGGQSDDQAPGHSPGGNAQDTTNILGSVIRIDVDARTSVNGQYGVPASNPLCRGARGG